MNISVKHNGILLDITLSLLRISKKDFSEKINVSASLLSRYLSEERFSEKRLEIITNALSLPTNYFDTHLPSIEQLMTINSDNQYPSQHSASNDAVWNKAIAAKDDLIQILKAETKRLQTEIDNFKNNCAKEYWKEYQVLTK